MPLLLTVLVGGFLHMPLPARLGAFLLPALLLGVSIPAATESHRDSAPPSVVPPERLEKAKAIYTEEPRLARAPGWQLILAAESSRSVVIYEKPQDVRLYRVERLPAP
jgi:hypothetical protein